MSSRSWFSAALAPWYREHKRSLPWRSTRDPYRIWLSEVMLQQTRVDQGLAYYLRFVDRWPTVADLAAAHEDEVLKEWQGLGYYSRARNLRTAARLVVAEHNGRFPDTHAALLKLKGVGDYTAAAIASICYDRPDAVVDGNVYRVLARAFGIATPIDSTAGRKQFKALATELLNPAHPGDHNQAVMELGATVCTPRNPVCMLCPLQPKCIAFKEGRIAELPVKQGQAKVRARYFNYLHVRHGETLYVRQRTGKDIWQGLFEPPLLESAAPLTKKEFEQELKKASGPGWKVLEQAGPMKHVLSHQVIQAMFWSVTPPKGFKPPADWVPMDPAKHAVPRLIERWLEERK
jgi:A/G-specific adenine glycosylase